MFKNELPEDILQIAPALNEWAILIAYRGSIAHGMYVPNSNPDSIDDKDIMAVCIPPVDHYFGLKEFGSRGTKEIFKEEWDIVIYEYQKFISLLEKGNPNVLSMLWLDDQFYIHQSKEGKYLLENRHFFIGKHVYHSFVGYAQAQLYKMDHLAFKGYMGEKRKRLVEKFGYDTKNAAHLIRLLRMGIEFLNEGKLYVTRPDNQELLAIKRGEWGLEKVKEEANKLFEKAKHAYNNSKLPNEPDYEAINQLCVTLAKMRFGYVNASIIN